MFATPGVTLRWFLNPGIFAYWFRANKQALKTIKAWIGWHFTGKVGLMTFLKKHFHIKLTSNRRKQNRTKQYLLRLTRERGKQKRSPPTGVERLYAFPSAQQVRCVTHWATGGLLNKVTQFSS